MPRDIAVIIQHVPWVEWRGECASAIESTLRQSDADIEVRRVSARRDEQVYETAIRCWQTGYRTGADYVVLIQDDVSMPPEFGDLLQGAVDALPDHAPSVLYTSRKFAREVYEETGANWIRVHAGISGQGRGMPADEIGNLEPWYDACWDPSYRSDDTRESTFFRYWMDEDVWMTIPNLVQHIGADRSNLGHNPPVDRTSKCYIEEYDIDPESIDWTIEDPQAIPTHRGENYKTRFEKQLTIPPELDKHEAAVQ